MMKYLELLLLFLFFSFFAKSSINDYNRDTLLSFLGKSEYRVALNYIESHKDSMTLKEDSLHIEWLIDYSLVSTITLETDTAFKSLVNAKEIANKIKSSHLAFKANIHLIELYRKMRLYDKALALIRPLITKLQDQTEFLQCRFYHRAAAVYNEKNYTNKMVSFLDTALLYSQKSLDISVKNKDLESQATSLNELGNIYERIGRMEDALSVYDKSIQLWYGRNKLNYANAIKNKGSYFLRQKKYDSSIIYFERVLKLVNDDINLLMISNTYWGLKNAYKAIGDSLNYYKYGALDAHYNTLHTQQKLNNKILDLTMAYEAKEKDILLEKSRNLIENEQRQSKIILFIGSLLTAIILGLIFIYLVSRKKNARLNNLLAENEFLIGESNHRIKNNLQLIISIIGREIYKSDSNKQKLIELSDKINSIATLHQHLYLRDTKENVSIADYINDIIENFNNAEYFEDIDIKVDVEDIGLQIDKSVYLGLLITELITNTIKHAFTPEMEREKVITIIITKMGNTVELLYEDSGKGIDDDINPSLVHLLTKQLKAELKKEKNHSYSISVNFKV